MIVALTEIDKQHIREYIEEVDALIDADEDCIFTSPFLDKHEVVKEIFYAID